MKILHLIQRPQLRGAEVFACQLAKHIQQSGNVAIIVSLFPGEAHLPFNGKKLNLNGNINKRLTDVRAWKRLAAIVKEEKPDIIQANAGDTLLYAVFSKILYRWQQPIVFRNASTISLYIKSALAQKWHSFFYAYVSKVISVSEASAKDFATLFPKCKKKIVHIPIGIETDIDMPATGNNNPFAACTGPVIVHVGGFSFEKNHKGLLNIFTEVLRHQPDASLHLIGDGPMRKEIEKLVAELGLGAKVVFYGFQKEPLQFIIHADVLVLPSLIEGLPGVILEAFYCKTPVVAYNVGGIKEILIPNKTGRLVEKGNEAQFSKEVMAALDKTDQHEEMITNAYKLVVSEYANATIANRFLAVYNEVLNKRSSKAPVLVAGAINE